MEIVPSAVCRREWQVWGEYENRIIFGEVKSITDNNWGNKSKELYDRLLDTREIAEIPVSIVCVCVFLMETYSKKHIVNSFLE